MMIALPAIVGAGHASPEFKIQEDRYPQTEIS
jgi:hypothetical protein